MSARPIRTFTPPLNQGRAGSSDSSSLKSFLDKGPGIPIPQRQNLTSPELKSALSKSAPTTPGPSKKHAHFDDVKIEHRYSLHRTITAPSSFESTPSLLIPDMHDSAPQHLDPVSMEDSPPRSPDESSDAEESDGSTSGYMDATHSRSLLRRSNTGDSIPTSTKHVMTRWSSDPEQRTIKVLSQQNHHDVASLLHREESDSSHSSRSVTSSIIGGTLQLPASMIKRPAECATTHVSILARAHSTSDTADPDSVALLDTRLSPPPPQSVYSPSGSFKAA
ncbi:hypothetical protein BDZ85DRAFT_50603 [Elsinoe ampelina]|uniref:Uncharacterized protein n=1 Tax=Elsinoe ampelina TaxID=302913 RepID=A0A6A6GL80_9PEZI|nr:hypothetical protein BDZ85DRAFT_50603 [Elsinoe ampelina]